MDLQNKCKPAKLFFNQYTPESHDPNLLPIIFVHGFCSLHTTWNAVWKKIADQTKRQVFSFDLRNHGKSEWNDCFGLESLIVDLEHFLVENNIQKCIFVAHSLGGRACMHLALQKPELVDRLIIEESAFRNPTEEQELFIKTLFSFLPSIKLLPKGISEEDMRKLFTRMVSAKFPGNPYTNVGYFLPVCRTAEGGFDYTFNFPTLERTMKDFSVYSMDMRGYRNPFPRPVLFIHAEESYAGVEEDKSIVEYFPKAEFCKFNSKGHILHRQCPSEYVEKVVRFINS